MKTFLALGLVVWGVVAVVTVPAEATVTLVYCHNDCTCGEATSGKCEKCGRQAGLTLNAITSNGCTNDQLMSSERA